MKIKHVLTPELVTLDLRADNKQGIIEELLDLLISAGKVKSSDRTTVLADLLERERKMSTGIQFGVAIPHTKTRAVKELVACVGLKPGGVDFAALDGQPSDIFIMTVSSITKTGPHVQFLAEISMVLKSEEARAEILRSKTPEDVLKVFGI